MEKYLNERINRLQKYTEEKNLAGILFLRPQKQGYDLWLTGKNVEDAKVSYLDKAFLLVRGAERIFSINTIKLLETGSDEPYTTHATEGEAQSESYINVVGYFGEHFRALLADNHRLGLVNGENMLLSVRKFIQEYAPEVEFVDVTKEINLLKAYKSGEEIALLKKDLRDLEHVMSAAGVNIRPEATEREIAYAFRKNLLERGASGWDYSIQCLDVVISSAPDGGDSRSLDPVFPGHRVALGDRVNVKINAAMSHGFHAHIARSYVLGEASEASKGYWSLAVQAQDAAAAMLKPGMTIGAIVEKVNKEIFAPAGVAADNSNWIFGVGQAWAEYPMAIPGWSDIPLEENMVLAVGPSVKIEGQDPYCCQDVYRVTSEGGIRLGKSNRELKEIFNTVFQEAYDVYCR